MRNKGLLLFLIGMIIGLVGNIGARKARKIEIFPENWQNSEDMQHWA